MNYCRECHKIIPNLFNGGPALRCAECRALKDEEFMKLDELVKENELLKDSLTNHDDKLTKTKMELVKSQQRYQSLWNQHSVILNDNQRLEAENERLRKGIERLFDKIHTLEGKNAEGQKDYERLKDAFNDVLYDKKEKCQTQTNSHYSSCL